MAVREDMRGKQHAKRLFDYIYKKYKGKVDFIDWGKIMHPAIEKLFYRYRDLREHGYPYTKGKTW